MGREHYVKTGTYVKYEDNFTAPKPDYGSQITHALHSDSVSLDYVFYLCDLYDLYTQKVGL